MTSPTVPLISFDQLQKDFGPLQVLRGVTGEIYPKDVISIIGPSGCGKSTFLRCLNRLEPISGGRLEVAGVDLSGAKIDQKAFQSFSPPDGFAKSLAGPP